MKPNGQNSLRVLITNIVLDGRSGTEIVTRNLAMGLHRDGHSPIVYSPQTGEIARELRAIGIPVLSSIDQLCEKPDIIHGHHTTQTSVAAIRFPQTPAIFVCHDFGAWHDVPPRLSNIVRYVAVGDATRDRLTIENGISPAMVAIVENGVDMDRFKPGPDLPARPKTGLLIAKSWSQIAPIVEACAMRDITLTVVGPAVGELMQNPEQVMPQFDIVFASGLTAIEALSCLRPVVVCDGRGLAGMVTLQNYAKWRQQNFGLRTLSNALTAEAFTRELDRYSASEATSVGLLVRREAALTSWVARYVALYQDCIGDFAIREKKDDDDHVHAAMQFQSLTSPGNPEWDRERGLLQAELLSSQTGLETLQVDVRIRVDAKKHIALIGFHPLEKWGAWSARTFCSLVLRFPMAGNILAIQIEYLVFLTPAKPRMEITALVNGEPAITWAETKTGEAVQSGIRVFAMPPGFVATDEVQFLSFRTSHVVSPSSENVSLDSRPLSIAIIALTVLSNHSPESPTMDSPNV